MSLLGRGQRVGNRLAVFGLFLFGVTPLGFAASPRDAAPNHLHHERLAPVTAAPLLRPATLAMAPDAHREEEGRPSSIRAKLVTGFSTEPTSDEILLANEFDPESLPSPSDLTIDVGAAQNGPHAYIASTRQSTPKPWLDIRPRSIDPDDMAEVVTDEVPKDISGLPRATATVRSVQVYALNLRMRDFCRSASFSHRPLYFEDCPLERRGASPGLLGHCPSIRSGAHFLADAALLPLSAIHQRPCSCVPNGCACR